MAPAIQTSLHQQAEGTIAECRILAEKGLNVVDGDILRAAATALQDVYQTPDLRVVLLSGKNENAFVGGANLNALEALTTATAEAFIRSVHELCAALREGPVPTIAVMQGYCLGAGLEIAAACDIRIGDHSVFCGMPEVKVGVPSVVEAALLPGLIGWGKARELMLRGNIIDAAEAYRWSPEIMPKLKDYNLKDLGI